MPISRDSLKVISVLYLSRNFYIYLYLYSIHQTNFLLSRIEDMTSQLPHYTASISAHSLCSSLIDCWTGSPSRWPKLWWRYIDSYRSLILTMLLQIHINRVLEKISLHVFKSRRGLSIEHQGIAYQGSEQLKSSWILYCIRIFYHI